MSFRLLSGNLDGIEGRIVEVEVDLIPALSSFVISGLAGPGIKESRERIRSALENSGYRFPDRYRIVINLAPAAWQKDGAVFDLPIALSILAESGQVPKQALARWAALGELALDGRLRKVPGTLGIVSALSRASPDCVLVPAENRSDARQVGSIRVEGARDLREAIEVIVDGGVGAGELTSTEQRSGQKRLEVDLSDVVGHEKTKRALEIAAAGEHPMLMVGPPGSGKSYLASRLPTLLPPLAQQEKLEVTHIHDVCHLHQGSGLVHQRPFRSPHHSVTWAGLIGGGSPPVPGEVTLAHRGVLFLDELPEISRRSLEALREPLETGEITISRAKFARTYPAQFLLIAAMNPCPCGAAPTTSQRGSGAHRCRCSASVLASYRAKISGPLLDRFDIRIAVETISGTYLFETDHEMGESSSDVSVRVELARERALLRGQQGTNRNLQWKDRQRWAPLSTRARQFLIECGEQGDLSTRGMTRLLRLGRTIADLRAADRIEEVDLIEALSLRGRGSALS